MQWKTFEQTKNNSTKCQIILNYYFTFISFHLKQEISAVNYLTIQGSHFGTDKMTRINIPGWKSDGKWQQDMCNV